MGSRCTHRLSWLLPLLAIASLSSAALPDDKSLAKSLSRSAFIENAGQWDGRARFMMPGKGINLWLTQEGARYQFSLPSRSRAERPKSFTFQMNFVGGRSLSLNPGTQMKGILNFAKVGDNPSKQISGVRRYDRVSANNVYPGIDVQFASTGDLPRYDLIVKPGADPAQIGVQFEGIRAIRPNANGSVELVTPVGKLEHKDLVAYQETANGRKPIACKMACNGTVLNFKVGSYDRSKPLIIDPVIAATYFGSFYTDVVGKVAAVGGRALMAGISYGGGVDFPVSLGLQSQGDMGIFASELTSDLTELIYSTFLTVQGDGSNQYAIYDACLDDLGRASVIFDVQRPLIAGLDKVETSLARLDQNGRLLSETGLDENFLDVGTTNSDVYRCATNRSGSVIVIGRKKSEDGIVDASLIVIKDATSTLWSSSSGQHATGVAVNDLGDVAMCGLDPTGKCFVTVFGANHSENGVVMNGSFGSLLPSAITFTPAGNIVMAGRTSSTTLPASNGFQPTKSGGVDSFLMAMSSGPISLLGCTYLGGTGDDGGLWLQATNDSVWVGGSTTSSDFPATGNLDSFNSGKSFVSALDLNLTTLKYSLLWHSISGFAVDDLGKLTLGGQTSDDIPTTPGSYQPNPPGPYRDYFAVIQTGIPLSGVTISPQTVYGGDVTKGKVILKYPAPTGGAEVNLSSNDPHTLVPSKVIVQAGQTVGTFTITTKATASEITNTVTAGSGASTAKANIRLLSGLGLGANISVDHTTIVSGSPIKVTVSMASAQSVNVTASLASSQPTIVPLPPSVVIPKGSTSVSFVVATSGVAGSVASHLYVNLYGSKSHADVTISSAVLSSFTFTPSTVIAGKASVGRLNLNGLPGPSGSVYALTSVSGFLHFPSSITVPAGAKTAVFTVNSDGVVSSQVGTVKATKGADTKSATLTVDPATLSGVKLSVASVKGGRSVGGTITLTGKAPAGGLTVNLASNNTAIAKVPSSAIVAAQTSTVTFSLTTVAVSANKTVTITAKSGSQTYTATLTITP